jgi:carbon-monoxide dehydrogenase small subunit
MSRRVTLQITVNGARRRVKAPPMKRLLDVLREECGLTGTKEGCGEGECGACTVLMDGRSVNSCLVPAVHADGARIVTVEGLARGARLNALQRAFLELGGAQCGICTPGMLVTSMELLARARGRVPGDAEVREALSGNLCRCTGYQRIVDAVRAAAQAAAKPARRAAPQRARRAGAKVAAQPSAKTAKPARPASRSAAKRAAPGAATRRAATKTGSRRTAAPRAARARAGR